MRRSVWILLVVVLATAGCTAGTSDGEPKPKPARSSGLSLDSLDLAWPAADGELTTGDRPATPDGYDDATLDRMASALVDWARVASVEDAVWHSAAPIEQVSDVLPPKVAATLRTRAAAAVSPRLAIANVFAADVTVIGSPQVTSAWKVSTKDDEAGKPFVLLELQTRTAYEVRVGDDGPTKVIGMLRVQGLSAFKDTTDDFGVSYGWQEFGAGDCALALDDDLLPDSDLAGATKDLETFVTVGNGKDLVMPKLGVEEQVDDEYLRRCRQGSI